MTNRRVLLLAEALNHLSRSHFCGVGCWIVGGLRGKRGVVDLKGSLAEYCSLAADGIFAARLGCGGVISR